MPVGIPQKATSFRRHGRVSRRAMALPLVLMCVTLIVIFAATLARTVALQHKQLKLTDYQQQAFWLAESGLQRAISRLEKSDSYAGEQWHVPSEQLDDEAGLVVIKVTPLAEEQGWNISAEAFYPDTPHNRVNVRRQRKLLAPNDGELSEESKAEEDVEEKGGPTARPKQ